MEDMFETVATLFAITVLVDHHEREPELLEFIHACEIHNALLRPEKITPPKELRQWYQAARATILEALDQEGDPYKISLLTKITDPELRRSVLSSMFTISVADHDFHESENALIKIALAAWDAVPPTPSELEQVA